MASDITAPPAAAPQKLSRYRSVRRAQEQQAQQTQHCAPPLPPMPPMPEAHTTSGASQCDTPNSNIGRSMSRYHRRPPSAHATSPNAPPLRSSTAPQAPPLPQTALDPSSSARHRAASTPQQPQQPQSANNVQPRPRTAKYSDGTPPLSRDVRQHAQQQYDDPRTVLQKERERQRLLKEKMEAEARALKEAKIAEIERLEKLRLEQEEAARLEAERVAEAAEALRLQREEEKAEKERGKKLRKAEAQKMLEEKKEAERRAKLEKENRARLEEKSRLFQSQSSGSPPTSPPQQEGFGLFKRRKDEGLSLSSEERPTTSRPRTARQDSSNEKDTRPRTARQVSSSNQPDAILTGGGGAVLGIDAPTSAVNGGERRVTVVFNKRRIQLPVTPTTTPLDLFKSADVILTDTVPVRTAVALEWFKKVDIKRPLRNYEYVRDVMNSWDYDDQNELIIMDSAIDGIDQDELLSYGVPEKRPEGMSCMLNYSSRPGKWAKRYFLLRPDGQLVTAKNDKSRDQENVCHLTDYDIYHVTQAKVARVKPPKKIVFAVKSLQKSNIFADESQYVHFFCTNDRGIADTFWKALQSWRSWHLKYEKGEGLKKSPATKKVLDSAGPGILPGAPSHNRGESVGSHYQLGAFTSLIDMSDFNKKLDEIEIHKPGEYPDDAPLSKLGGAQAMHARQRSIRAKQAPPLSRGLAALATSHAPEDNSRKGSMTQSFKSQDEETFAAGGLLGRTYTTRQKAAAEREQKQNGAFTDGPSLISNMDYMAAQNGSGLNRSSSTRSSHHRRTSSDMRRTASKRKPGMPQPLVDLTPQYKPPPQYARQGKGYNPGANAGPLVESATSMEEAIVVPSSTDWRAKPRPVYAPQPNERTKSLKGRGQPLAAHTFNNHNGAPQDDREAFTGGLLSQAGYAQGRASVGRGVMDGSKARGPMLDFGDEKQFQTGSLLANIPNTNLPVIDRSGR